MIRKDILLMSFSMMAVGALAVGCFNSRLISKDAANRKLPTEAASEADGRLKVQVQGSQVSYSSGQVAKNNVEILAPETQKLLREQRGQSARAYVGSRPDLALEYLRTNFDNSNDRELYAFIAETYDLHMGLNEDASWNGLLKRVASDSTKQYARMRKSLVAELEKGEPEIQKAQELMGAAQAIGHAGLELDACTLAGLLFLVAERPKEAVDLWTQAVREWSAADPFAVCHLKLYLSDALRRAGDNDSAEEVWNEAVVSAAKLVERRGAMDPAFWDRASYLRPVTRPWPKECFEPLSQHGCLPPKIAAGMDGKDGIESIVWSAIANELMRRAEYDSSLVAAKRAEAAAPTETAKNWLRLSQARALASLYQTPAAVSVLVALTTSRDKPLARAAMAQLGVIRLNQGDVDNGYGLLQKGLAGDDLDWPNRDQLQADFGLACLLRNRPEEGLTRLREAQSSFQRQGKVEEFYQSLWNERAYFRERANKKEVARLDAALEKLEAVPPRQGQKARL